MEEKVLGLTDTGRDVLAQRLKSARKELGIRQNKICELMNCSIGHLSAIENGHIMPNCHEIVCFCQIYNKNIQYFFENLIYPEFNYSYDQEKQSAQSLNDQEPRYGRIGLVSEKDIRFMQRFLVLFEEDLSQELKKLKRK